MKLFGYDLFMLSVLFVFVCLFLFDSSPCINFGLFPLLSETFWKVCYREGGVPVLEEQQEKKKRTKTLVDGLSFCLFICLNFL